MNRRSILKLFGAAPVGLPVVAREAASKAGISSVGSYGAMMAGGFEPESGCGPSNQAWAMKFAKRVFAGNWLSEKKEEWRTRHVTVLVRRP